MASPLLYIAGVGISQIQEAVSNTAIHNLALSAGAKALLDAGITYDNVNHSIACFLDGNLKIPKSIFDSFGRTGASVSEVDCPSGLFAASQTIQSGYSNCTLMISLEKDTSRKGRSEAKQGQISAIAVVLISDGFLLSHAYLKDSSLLVCGSAVVNPIHSSTSRSNSHTLTTKTAIRAALQHAGLVSDVIDIINSSPDSTSKVKDSLRELSTGKDKNNGPQTLNLTGTTGLSGLCELVWQLRGWTQDKSTAGIKTCLQCVHGLDGTAYVTILRRADGNSTPKWKDIEHLRDGRERVGYNPAIESKNISFEDWLAVKSRDEFVPETTRKQIALPLKGGDRAALARL